MAATPPILVILGPTASGKSDVALSVARQAGAEILSVDSMQVYRGMDVGTAKPSPAERAEVVHHLLDVVEPSEPFTVARFVELADSVIADAARRTVPLVATGGTPLYHKALFEGLFEGPGADDETRGRLRALPDEDVDKFFAEMTRVIADPAVKVVPVPRIRPPSPASRIDTDMYRAMEQAAKSVFPGAMVLPSMSTGASDQAQLRAKGIQSYGIGPASTEADATDYPAHGDVERLAESSLYPFVQYVWNVVTTMAAHK